jgi:SNF2 family DNA or RNA helicase
MSNRLNLAVAKRIYLLEPQWNPSIESQAVGRALRIGQTKHVVIIRYTTINTVEEVYGTASIFCNAF